MFPHWVVSSRLSQGDWLCGIWGCQVQGSVRLTQRIRIPEAGRCLPVPMLDLVHHLPPTNAAMMQLKPPPALSGYRSEKRQRRWVKL